VDNPNALNAVNAGRAIPVRFSLGGNQGLVDSIEETVTATTSSLSYDATTDRYQFVWKTEKTWAGSCRQLVLKLVDGTLHRANFGFAK
jgi:hypothetical protein